MLNQEYQITEIVDNNSYKIDARAANTPIYDITVDGQLTPTYVTANGSDSGNGGGSVVGAYQINTGLDITCLARVGVQGHGAVALGALLYRPNRIKHYPSLVARQLWRRLVNQRARRRHILLGSNRNRTHGPWTSPRWLVVQSVPTVAKQVMVSDRDRHVLAFGCDTEANPGVQDPLGYTVLGPRIFDRLADNRVQTRLANCDLGSGSEIVTAVETRQQVLVFTDTTSVRHAVPWTTVHVWCNCVVRKHHDCWAECGDCGGRYCVLDGSL